MKIFFPFLLIPPDQTWKGFGYFAFISVVYFSSALAFEFTLAN